MTALLGLRGYCARLELTNGSRLDDHICEYHFCCKEIIALARAMVCGSKLLIFDEGQIACSFYLIVFLRLQ